MAEMPPADMKHLTKETLACSWPTPPILASEGELKGVHGSGLLCRRRRSIAVRARDILCPSSSPVFRLAPGSCPSFVHAHAKRDKSWSAILALVMI